MEPGYTRGQPGVCPGYPSATPYAANVIFRYLAGLEKVNISQLATLANSSFPWLPDLLHVLLGPLQSLDKTVVLLGRTVHDLRHIEV